MDISIKEEIIALLDTIDWDRVQSLSSKVKELESSRCPICSGEVDDDTWMEVVSTKYPTIVKSPATYSVITFEKLPNLVVNTKCGSCALKRVTEWKALVDKLEMFSC